MPRFTLRSSRFHPAAPVLVPAAAVAIAALCVAGCGGGDDDRRDGGGPVRPTPSPAAAPGSGVRLPPRGGSEAGGPDGGSPDAAISDAALAEPSMEQEVLGNILAQPLGDGGATGTVADLGLPDRFLARLVDRVIRSSYQEEFHAVVGVEQEPPPFAAVAVAPPDAVRRVDAPADAATAAAWLDFALARPARRGMIAPVLERPLALEPPEAREPVLGVVGVGGGAPPPSVVRLVSERLASDGLLRTLGRVAEAYGPQTMLAAPEAWVTKLREAGYPVDLLVHFGRADQEAVAVLPTVISTVARIVADSGGADAAGWRLTEVPFRWRPTVPGFRVMTESGEGELAQLRVQLTRGAYWRGPGAGGSLDVARQLVERLPGVDLVASVERRFADDLAALALSWPMVRAGHLTLVVEPMVVSQWAQDNAKPGRVGAGPGGVLHLVPRYASRREDGSVFVPGESALVDGLAASGLRLAHSPLLFQGGNLLPVRHPATGERILLIGEAELHRNTALGLTTEQATAAFAAELGVDRVEVLPAVAFHIDYDMSVRAVGDRLVAFVNDPEAAARAIVLAGAAGLRDGGLLSTGIVQSIGADFAAGRTDAAVRSIGGPLMQVASVNDGHYPVPLAATLATGPHESGVGNLRPLLCALDTLFAEQVGPPTRDFGRYATAYLRAYHRLKDARAELHARLEALGFDLVLVPGLPEGERGIIYVNGVHDRTRYLMPAWGGRYASVDAIAQQAFAAALGPEVEVIPILCAETQRRHGALHCAVSAVYGE